MDITLFEIHLDGAQFGPATIGGEAGDAGEESTAVEAVGSHADGGSRSFGRRAIRFVPVVIAFGVAAGYVASRRFRGTEGTDDGEGAHDAGSVDVESVEIEA